jgi:hypothetical protein
MAPCGQNSRFCISRSCSKGKPSLKALYGPIVFRSSTTTSSFIPFLFRKLLTLLSWFPGLFTEIYQCFFLLWFNFTVSGGYMYKHQLIHSGPRPYACDVCNKTLNYKSSLKKHQLIHSGQWLYVRTPCSLVHGHEWFGRACWVSSQAI